MSDRPLHGDGTALPCPGLRGLPSLLREAEMTQARLERLTGICQSTLSRIIRGVYDPRQSQINAIRAVLTLWLGRAVSYDELQELPQSARTLRPGSAGFGRRLRDARLKAGMTQGDLAAALGVSRGTVSTWERETFAPTPHHLAAAAERLNGGSND